MGQIVAHFYPSRCEQKVDVIHSGGAQGESTPLGICPQQRSADTGNSMAQDFCNTKDCPPALAHKGHSQQSGSYIQDQSAELFVYLLLYWRHCYACAFILFDCTRDVPKMYFAQIENTNS